MIMDARNVTCVEEVIIQTQSWIRYVSNEANTFTYSVEINTDFFDACLATRKSNRADFSRVYVSSIEITSMVLGFT